MTAVPKPKRSKKIDNPLKPKSNKMIVYDEKADKGREDALQSNVEEYLKYKHNIDVVRIPNWAYRAIFANQHIPQFVKIKIADYLAGVPDLILLKKQSDVYCKALCIELKSEHGKSSKRQKKFAGIVPVHEVRSFDKAKELIDEFDRSQNL
jgi:hypothetical protein